MENNTQLPVEVVEQIKTNAALRCDRNEGKDDNSFRNGYYSGYVSGATAYATKLHECDNANKALEEKNRGLAEEYFRLKKMITSKQGQLSVLKHENNELRRQNEKMKAQAEGWRPLLEGALRENNHTAMYPDHFIEKIKKFLYGHGE